MTTYVLVAGPFVRKVTLLDTVASAALLLKHPSPFCHLSSYRALLKDTATIASTDEWIQTGVCV